MGVEVRGAVEPRDVADLARRAEAAGGQAVLVVAPFLSPRTCRLLREAGLGHADLTGNVRLALSEPGLFLETTGETRNPWRTPRPLTSLKGPAAARAVRALCDFRPPYGTSELAAKARASLATTSRVVSFLAREALLETRGRGQVVTVAWRDLIRRWTEDYSLLRTNAVARYLQPRGLGVLEDALRSLRQPYAVTGALALPDEAAIAPPRMAAVFVEDSVALARALDLVPSDDGANVLLIEPFGPVVFDRQETRNGLVCAALSQVAADLLTSPGRGPSEGEALPRWMAEREDAWRA